MSKVRFIRKANALEIREGFGCVALLGLPVLIVGVLVWWLGYAHLHAHAHDRDLISILLPGCVGAAFVLGGAVFLFGRTGVRIDLGRKRVVRWFQVLLRFQTASYPLLAFERVFLDVVWDVESSDKRTYGVYLVGEEANVQLLTTASRDQAWLWTRTVARFLGLEATDEVNRQGSDVTTDVLQGGVTRAPDSFSGPGPMPVTRRFSLRETADGVVIELAPVGFHFFQILAMGFAVFFAGTALVFAVLPFAGSELGARSSQALQWIKWAAVVVMTLAFVLLPLAVTFLPSIWHALSRCELVASSHGLTVQRRLGFWVRRNEIATGDLLSLELASPMENALSPTRPVATGLRANGIGQTIEFGAGLSPEELVWLRDELRSVLASQVFKERYCGFVMPDNPS